MIRLSISLLLLFFSLCAFAQPEMDISITDPDGADVLSESGYDKAACKESKVPCKVEGHLKEGTKIKLLGVMPLYDSNNKDVDFYEVEAGTIRGFIRGDQTSVYTTKIRSEPPCPPGPAPKSSVKTVTAEQAVYEKMRDDQIAALVDAIENKMRCLDTDDIDAKKDKTFGAGFKIYKAALDAKIDSLKQSNEIDFSKFSREQLNSADAWARTLFGEMGTTCYKNYGTAYYKIVARVGMNRSYHARRYKNSPYAGPDISCSDRVDSVPYVLGSDAQFSMFNRRDNQFKVMTCVDLKKYPFNKQAWHDAVVVAVKTVVNPGEIIKSTGGSGAGGITQLHYTSGVKPYWAKKAGWSDQTKVTVDNVTVDNPACMRVWRGPQGNYKENKSCEH